MCVCVLFLLVFLHVGLGTATDEAPLWVAIFFCGFFSFFVSFCGRLVQVFRARTPLEAIDLVSRLLEYTPSARISPLTACAHPFFDELRDPHTRLPSGRELPPLFNFTEHGNRSCW